MIDDTENNNLSNELDNNTNDNLSQFNDQLNSYNSELSEDENLELSNNSSDKFSSQTEPSSSVQDLEAVYDVPVQISAVLGRSTMPVHQLLKLGRGAIVELDRRVGEAIDIYVNNRLIARGEVVVVDEYLGVTMTEIIKSDRK